MSFNPRPYQAELIDFTLDRLADGGGVAWWVEMGGGKTACALSIIETLRNWWGVRKVLVVAPLRVCYSVWPYEIQKWGFSLCKSIVHGTPKKRTEALETEADVYLINPEGVAWLSKQKTDFDFLIIDESSKFKTWGSKRSKALRGMVGDIPRRLELTGTPCPKNYEDVFPQAYLLDEGETLGKTAAYFRANYCYRGGFKGRQWKFKESKAKDLEAAIAHMVIRQDAEDFGLDLPPMLVQDVYVELPKDARKIYNKVERELFAELDSGAEITATSGGSKYVMCKGLANGGAYVPQEDGSRVTEEIHGAKVEAVADMLEELYGAPLLLAYQFNHDRDRLLSRFPDAVVICGGQKPEETDAIIEKWERGEIPLLLVQCQALSHGVDRLQHGGRHLAWFGLTDQLEIYLQLNARLHRSGQTGPVMVHRILARGTVDEAMAVRLDDKDKAQGSLLDSLKAYRERKRRK